MKKINAFIKSNELVAKNATMNVKKEEVKASLLEAIATLEHEKEDSTAVLQKISYEIPDEDASDDEKTKYEQAEEITVVFFEAVTEAEIDNYIKQNTNEFLDDESAFVRLQAVKRGYGLSTAINDEDSRVRVAVAEQKYGLDELISDENKYVRMAVARQGYGLDILVKDRSSYVRAEVARQCHGLDVLVDDNDSYVLVAVAEQGYGHEKLVKNTNSHVRIAVTRTNPNYLPELANDLERDVRVVVAEKAAETANIEVLDILANDQSVTVRRKVAELSRKYDETFAKDEDSYVRAEVAKAGYNPESFLEDESWHVRKASAGMTGFEGFLKDKNPAVRKAAWDKIHEETETEQV